jgi:hypothetical protein
LILLVCSADGIQTNDFSSLLGDIEKKEPLAPLYWARTRRILKPYIKEIGARENISFYHMEIHKVKNNILVNHPREIHQPFVSHLTTKWNKK